MGFVLMYLAMIRLEIRVLEGSRVKRRAILAITDKIHRHFNVSVAEVDKILHSSESVIAVAAVGSTRREVRETLDRVADAVTSHPRAELLSLELIEF